MIGAKGNNTIRPVALGTTVQSATYGSVIPVIFGRIKSNLLLIWEANIRQTSGKKGKPSKKGKLKGQSAQYSANVDFLIGHNPIMSPLQFWVNQGQKLPLKFVKVSGVTTISDPNFYAVIAVTMSQSYGPITFNDYGSPTGSVTVSGDWEMPLWNAAYHGPDPAIPNLFNQRFGYLWTPAMGNTITLIGQPGGTVNIYYAQLWPDGAAQYGKKQSGTDIPAAALNLTFEPILGDGPEYTGNDSVSGEPLSNQQIYYPSYAGLGSQAYQTAQTGLPEVSVEILGSYGINPDGDADFADIIEDVFKQGVMQPGFATASDPSPNQTMNVYLVQRALGCTDWPGMVQANSSLEQADAWLVPNPTIIYPRPNTPGSFLLVASNTGYGGNPDLTVADTAGNTWTAIGPPVGAPSGTGGNGQLWYATALGATSNEVTLTNYGYWAGSSIFELQGVDTLDATATTAVAGSLSITTTNAPGTPAYIFALATYQPNAAVGSAPPRWTQMGSFTGRSICYRIVYHPGTYTFTAPPGLSLNGIFLAAFKSADPPNYARPLGNILDATTMDQVRAQCKAYGLWGSMVMDSQQKAADWLETLYKAANAAPVWSGFKLKSIPYAEASAAGNGAVYNAPTASGPVATLTVNDFITDSGQPLYSVDRKAQVDVPNLLQMQMPAREADYNDVVVSQPMPAAIALFGSRKDSPQQFRCITDPVVARMILQTQINKQNNLRNTYSFKLNAKWKLLEPMDLITLPADPLTGLAAVDVRLTAIKEDEKYQLDCEAEPFVYGTYVPNELPVTPLSPYQAQGGGNPGNVNTPIIFEPVVRLYGATNQTELWLVVSCAAGKIQAASVGGSGGTGYTVGDILTITQSGASGGQVTVTAVSGGVVTGISPTITTAGRNYTPATNLATTGGTGSGAQIDVTQVSAGYGGCLVYISTDGGSSYNQIGQISGNAVTGVSTADWPAATDPDTTNDLPLDLSESDGELASYQAADRDNFVYPCYVAGGNTDIPYEIMTYNTATLTAQYQYTLKATGSGNELRRGVFGAPAQSAGVDHPSGSRFAFLGPVGAGSQPGLLKLQMDPLWAGKTLHFKFCAVNAFGSGVESLSDATDYTYTVLGTVGSVNPAGAPAQLFQINGA